jgi:hypothetical protein
MHSEERSTSITKQLVFHTRFAVKGARQDLLPDSR